MAQIETSESLSTLADGPNLGAGRWRLEDGTPHRAGQASTPAAQGAAWFAASVVGATLVGAALRVAPVLGSNFPLDDGGMFYVMVRDLQAHHLLLPTYTSYNASHFPFAYPPLGFYLAAILQGPTGWTLFDILRFLPLTLDLLCIPAFALLARALLGRTTAAAAAVVAFAVLPDSYYIELRGGGLTRAPGMLFALLTLFCVTRLCQTRKPAYLVGGTLFAVLTVLSHPEWAWFTVYSSVLLLVTLGHCRAAVIRSAALACAVGALTAPWWGAVLSRYGVQVLAASVTGSSAVWPWYLGLGRLLELRLTDELWLPVATLLALLGVASCLAERKRLLPVWLLAACLVDARGLVDRSVIVVALLAGVGFSTVLLPALLYGPPTALLKSRRAASPTHLRLTATILGVLLVQAVLGSYLWESYRASALSSEDRAAMGWVQHATPPTGRFLVITGTFWGRDDRSEWFPALAGRPSVATVQGNEWIPGALARQDALSALAQLCAGRGPTCLERWIKASGARLDYVYIAKGSPRLPQPESDAVPGDCCWALRALLSTDRQYRKVYDGPGAAIFRRV